MIKLAGLEEEVNSKAVWSGYAQAPVTNDPHPVKLLSMPFAVYLSLED
ncbi:MAG: hypothetical protein KKE24_06285 [Candidatus Thermoplasmatota archaeon]|nr:hypothetical protein [Candidatus Thermoplasmatota archaeon]